MSSYKKSIICCSLLLILSGCSSKTFALKNNEVRKDFITVPSKPFEYEDQYIIYALEYENQKYYENAKEAYLKLFEKTNKYEYFIKYLTLSFHLKYYKIVNEKISKYMIEDIKEEEMMLRLNCFSLMKLEEKDKALQVAKKLLSKFESDINHELLGSIYLDLKDYTNSVKHFKNSFDINNSSTTLLTLTNIQYYYLNEKDEAKNSLQKYIDENGYIYNLSIQLLSFYEKDKEDKKLTKLLKSMYLSYKDNDNEVFFSKTRNLLISYLAKKNVFDAIDFLEKNDEESKILLSLYRSINDSKKAYDLLTKLYNQTNDLNYLAQQAIIEFEMSENKIDILDNVISKFNKVVENSDSSVYQNYLAYILIDYEKDIKRGISLVKKALEKEPKNLAYLDTLAWGQYKLNNCAEAYINMKKVVDGAGLKDSEIKFHWEKIKECIK